MATEASQDLNASKTYLDDWSVDLSKAASVLGLGSLTITSITSITVTGGGSIPSSSIYGGGTGVLFKFSSTGTTGVTAATPVDVMVTVKVGLSNGDSDVRYHYLTVTLNGI